MSWRRPKTREDVDGLKLATDVQSARQPMDGTLTLMSICDLPPMVRFGFTTTLEDILTLPEPRA